MRNLLLLALAVTLALPALPPVAAQAAPAAVEILLDPAGDVQVTAGGTPAANPTPRLGQLDLVGATVQEAESSFTFTLQVASLEDSSEPPLGESAFYDIHFVQNDVYYAIQAGRIKSQDTGIFAALSRYDPAEDRYYAIDYLETVADKASATLTMLVPRDLIVDSNGAKPYPGTALAGFWAESRSFMEIFASITEFASVPPPTVRDRMPDVGNGTLPVPVLLGPKQLGSARLSSQMPTRQSNGEAGTFLFTVEVRNVGGTEDRYRLSTASVPKGWTVTIQDDIVTLDGGASLSVPVIVAVPFTHTHGSFQAFLLHMESATDPASRADLELGIRYPKVPQPAGHHNQLFLHGAKWTDDPTVAVYAAVFTFNTEYAWMNALETDESDENVPVPSDGAFNLVPPVPGSFKWTVPLAPDLAIGLDFDTLANGTFVGSFEATAPLLQASLSGELAYYVDSVFDDFGTRIGGNRTVLARLAPSPPQDLLPGGDAPYTLSVAPTAAADLVPFRARSALVLELNLTGMRPDTFEARDPPRLRPGASLTLPLFEYRDPVDAVFAATPQLSLRAVSSQDRQVNPGETVVFPLTIRLAEDAGAHTVRVQVSGDSADWARLLDPPEKALEPGSTWNVSVAIDVPASILPPTTADIIVRAQADDDPALRGIVRLYATVTTAQDLPDEAELASRLDHTQETATPALGLLAAVLVVAMAAWRRR